MRKLFCDICKNEIETSWANDKCKHQLKMVDDEIEYNWHFETCGKCLNDIRTAIFELQRKYLKNDEKAFDCTRKVK